MGFTEILGILGFVLSVSLATREILKDRVKIAFTFGAITGRELRVSVINASRRAVYLDDAGFTTPSGAPSRLTIPFDLEIVDEEATFLGPARVLQPGEPLQLRVTRDLLDVYLQKDVTTVSVRTTSSGRIHECPLPQWAIDAAMEASGHEG